MIMGIDHIVYRLVRESESGRVRESEREGLFDQVAEMKNNI